MNKFNNLDPVNHKGKTNTWLTPLKLIKNLGAFDLDPCGYSGHKTAKKIIVLPEDGLKNEWEGRVWLNPPYGKQIQLWIEKLKSHGNGIALVFPRTETNWFQNSSANAIFLIRGRISFINPNNKNTTNAGHGSCFLIYGENNIDFVKKSKIEGRMFYPNK